MIDTKSPNQQKESWSAPQWLDLLVKKIENDTQDKVATFDLFDETINSKASK